MEENINMQKLIESGYRIALLNSAEPERVVSVFKRFTLTTGRAVYDWSPEHGLYRLGIEHIFIPRTRSPADALAYVLSSRHYGVYLLRGFKEAMAKRSIQRLLLQIAEKDDGVRRLLMVLGEEIEIPTALQGHAVRLRHNVKPRSPISVNG